MAKDNKALYNKRYNGPAREVKCSCGGQAKLTKKTHYPFGKKSGGKSVSFYKCRACGRRFN